MPRGSRGKCGTNGNEKSRSLPVLQPCQTESRFLHQLIFINRNLSQAKRREESRRGRHECLRHGVEYTLGIAAQNM